MINKQKVEEFISEHMPLDAPALALILSKRSDLPSDYIINQIQGRKIAKQKIPDWTIEGITYPPKQALEQCSSSITGKYKASLISNGIRFIDLTGGLGVDSYYLGDKFREVVYVEANSELFEISKQNLALLMPNKEKEFLNITAEAAIKEQSGNVDLIYIDPDRRASKSSKGVKISDCSPNVARMEQELLTLSAHVMVKFSPLLDIKQAMRELKNITAIHVVAVDNDCKEVLLELKGNQIKDSDVPISCINFTKNGPEQFYFSFDEEEQIQSSFSEPLKYLYEPNVSILKAGAFKSIAHKMKLGKLATNSHFYTSNDYISEFPGKRFKVISVSSRLKGITKKANIISRNHPLKPEEIRKKGKIKDGGNDFLIATRLIDNQPTYILCQLM